jgi:NAD(P)-dependent dehydrogenase (short-subunit alcohol dehydrogenase family)
VLRCAPERLSRPRRDAHPSHTNKVQRSAAGRQQTRASDAATHGACAETVRVTLQTNALGPFLLSQVLVPLLQRSKRARIVNLSSGMGAFSEMEGERRLSSLQDGPECHYRNARGRTARQNRRERSLSRMGQDQHGRPECQASRFRRSRHSSLARPGRAAKAHR